MLNTAPIKDLIESTDLSEDKLHLQVHLRLIYLLKLGSKAEVKTEIEQINQVLRTSNLSSLNNSSNTGLSKLFSSRLADWRLILERYLQFGWLSERVFRQYGCLLPALISVLHKGNGRFKKTDLRNHLRISNDLLQGFLSEL